LAADLDRRFAQHNLPDHGDLLANLIKWTARESIPLNVEGRGLIDSHLYLQSDRLVVHLVNLTSAGTWRSPVHELIPVGPIEVRVRIQGFDAARSVRSIVSGRTLAAKVKDGWCHFTLDSILDHEVALIG
jgi:hypothetical protein